MIWVCISTRAVDKIHFIDVKMDVDKRFKKSEIEEMYLRSGE